MNSIHRKSKGMNAIKQILESSDLSNKFTKDVQKGQSAIMLKYIYKLKSNGDVIRVCRKLGLNYETINWAPRDYSERLPYLSFNHQISPKTGSV